MSEPDLFTRLTSVHRPDCEIFAEGPLPQPAPDPDTMAQTLGSDEAARYAEDCRAPFEDLRRVIGQLAGLMILAQLSRKADIADLTELTACRDRWQGCAAHLDALRPPAPLAPHRDQLAAAHAFCGKALHSFDALRPQADNTPVFDDIARLVRRAYAHLSAATSQKAGLEMADLTHACCSCGR